MAAAIAWDQKGPARLIIFRDFDPFFRPDSTGLNKIGFVTKSGTVRYPKFRRVCEAPISRIASKRHYILEVLDGIQPDNLEIFFTQNMPNLDLFDDGMRAVRNGNIAYFDSPIRLPILSPLTYENFKYNWDAMELSLASGDVIATLDSQSRLSRLIARMDHGTWSHVGLYTGAGSILEAITAGVVERNLNVYQSPRYRIGIYRPIDITFGQLENLLGFSRQQIGKPYNYVGVARLAAAKILGIRPRGTKGVSPNDLARSHNLRLIHII